MGLEPTTPLVLPPIFAKGFADGRFRDDFLDGDSHASGKLLQKGLSAVTRVVTQTEHPKGWFSASL
jgi:hypothetical protein